MHKRERKIAPSHSSGAAPHTTMRRRIIVRFSTLQCYNALALQDGDGNCAVDRITLSSPRVEAVADDITTSRVCDRQSQITEMLICLL